MAVNRNKPDCWKRDIERSVDMYNNWFKRFAPDAYRSVRIQATRDVEATLSDTDNLRNIGAELLQAKVSQLRLTYGEDIQFILFLCGYFDSGYLGYEAAEGIDWVWEHRIDDLKEFGL